MIDQLGFPGYFLIVWDLVEFCRRQDIYCQGRGSAANSAACYALGITKADAVTLGLLFERFLSPERDGPPDIDLDIEAGRREEVIQYAYRRYGRERAAQVANVITYRARSAVRDMGRALGHAVGTLDAWSKQLDHFSSLRRVAEDDQTGIPEPVLALAAEVEHFPRHLGIHSGGMVICDRPVVEVCPVEWGRMADRTVLQWDKDDCAAAGLVKFDLLGLGMLTVLHDCIDLIAANGGSRIDLAEIPQDPRSTRCSGRRLDRGVPGREPGPDGHAAPAEAPHVLRPRRRGRPHPPRPHPGRVGPPLHPAPQRPRAVTYLHPLLEKSLAKTLGVPLFQEQLMQMAIDVAGFSPGEADQLRQAMGSKRSTERMERLRGRFYEGMAANGITGEVADRIFEKLAAFANFGFPESHSVSFAYLVYASSWLKLHHPAAFCAALLNAQPMGFWAPHTLVRDARRHGVQVRRPDVNISLATSSLEPCERSTGGLAVRLGLGEVRSVGDDLAERIAARRLADGAYTSVEDLVRRAEVPLPAVEALATAAALSSLGLDRRRALWAAGAAVQARPDRLEGIVTGTVAPALPGCPRPRRPPPTCGRPASPTSTPPSTCASTSARSGSSPPSSCAPPSPTGGCWWAGW
jgi:error-prone DNA polymerase